MIEAEQTFLPEQSADAETTLLTPRFDETEAQTAQPVVPLAVVARRRRIWPLLLVSALLGGAVSVFGFYLYQRQRAQAINAPNTTRQQTALAAPVAPPNAPSQAASSVAESSAAHEPVNIEPARETSAATPTDERAVVAAKRAPVKRSAHESAARVEPEKPARTASDETRPRLVDVIRGGDGAPRPRNERTKTNAPQPKPTRPARRNVDRIRDIFEGAPPQ